MAQINAFSSEKPWIVRYIWPICILAAIALGWLTVRKGIVIPGLLIALPFAIAFFIGLFLQPRIALITYIIYCFVIMGVIRHVKGPPFGLGMEALLLLGWLAILFYQTDRFPMSKTKNDLCKMGTAWMIINILEIGNPAGASIVGWFYEMRSSALAWYMIVPLAFMVFDKPRDLNLFLMLVLGFSTLGALYGIKQLYLGVDEMEHLWLEAGAKKTHLLFGKLRVFSFYSEAAQFGASQAHVAVISLVLALGPYKLWKKALFGIMGLLILYGMLISGTRGAMFVLAGGIFTYLFLSGQTRILILGMIVAMIAFGILKYTTIGNNNSDIVRMRTSLDPNDPSLQVRFKNQQILRDYMSSRPFGGGVGVIGMWGVTYNADKFLSTIPPDSLYVKVWAMYGIVGFLIWFGIMLYILGKCCGIVWMTEDKALKQKLAALTAGFAGVLLASYGNEVLNQMPSGMIVYLSWVFVFLGPQWELEKCQLSTASLAI
ncbi:O-antigen ligase family protein [Xanthocytophaga agilis]|uniref:O-antigen ligase family protein n=1 Tax=Xanthocytophaga agilis TaxID=3048010 RepID=A0AAE3R4W5_9BACT|nr:O-antigen ligase family protein [Xanthocytophaga agilis]MDJ1501459.1 O-antigen ligase family protein [Xanthocytophaga agilis]